MTECAEAIREFLIESHENLNALDRKLVELERTPADARRMATVFRAIHTLKGTSDFLGFHVISSIAHILESLLGQVRDKIRPLTPALVSIILEALDAVKQVLLAIERTNAEGADSFVILRERLSRVYQKYGVAAASKSVPVGSRGRPAHTSVQEQRTPAGKGFEWKEVRPADFSSREAESRSPMDPFEGTRATDRAANSTIRVDVGLLDKILALVDRLALADDQRGSQGLKGDPIGIPSKMSLSTTRELRDCVMLARMQPIGVIWNKFPRAVRDVASEMGKIIDVQMDGALTELDRTILEAISDPFTHMVRNACDHGIELPHVRVARGKPPQGTIGLRAFMEEGWVILQISDDGAGIDGERIKEMALQKGLIQSGASAAMGDQEALRLIFLPGLSTVETASSVSGRGIGMDVVKTNIERIHGTVEVASGVDVGTTITLRIPPRSK